MLGQRFDRARLGTAPVIQAICHEDQGVKVNKFCWDNPTPSNILHIFRRHNDEVTPIFHSLKLMEREGTGFDLMDEKLLVSSSAAVRPIHAGAAAVGCLVAANPSLEDMESSDLAVR